METGQSGSTKTTLWSILEKNACIFLVVSIVAWYATLLWVFRFYVLTQVPALIGFTGIFAVSSAAFFLMLCLKEKNGGSGS